MAPLCDKVVFVFIDLKNKVKKQIMPNPVLPL